MPMGLGGRRGKSHPNRVPTIRRRPHPSRHPPASQHLILGITLFHLIGRPLNDPYPLLVALFDPSCRAHRFQVEHPDHGVDPGCARVPIFPFCVYLPVLCPFRRKHVSRTRSFRRRLSRARFIPAHRVLRLDPIVCSCNSCLMLIVRNKHQAISTDIA